MSNRSAVRVSSQKISGGLTQLTMYFGHILQAIGEQMRLQCEEEFRKREQQRLQQILMDTKARAQR